jgi:hypothetical protein
MALSSAASLSNTFGRPRLFLRNSLRQLSLPRTSVGLLNDHYKNKRCPRPALIQQK